MKTELDKLITAAEASVGQSAKPTEGNQLPGQDLNVAEEKASDSNEVVSLDKWHGRIKQVADAFQQSAINGIMELVSSPKTQKELDDSIHKGFAAFCIEHLKTVIAMPETYGD